MKIGDKKRNYCAKCYKSTNHTVFALKKIDGSDDYHYSVFYCIVQCDGCGEVSYRTETVDYEQMTQYDGGEWLPDVAIIAYPEVLKNHRRLEDTYYLPKEIKNIYNEAISAFTSGCNLLTAVAFRAIIEAICKDKSIKGNDLNIQINKMVKNGLITQNEAERLHAVRFLGNDSVHEMSIPKNRQLIIVLGITEHLLKNLYLIDKELDDNLDTIIKDFFHFLPLLNVCIVKLKVGDSLPLNKILGKSVRRLNNNALKLEKELQTKIANGEYKYLKLGDLKPQQDSSKPHIQHYEIIKNQLDLEDMF